ncbi:MULTISPECIES: DUF4352 domain-containing protein [unclassified Microbacterium]|uniref:DUF4352 domain-containing protein n=1 Tax=unclassified Microbacterium TaxID=2609290 RepID=UPI0004453121|nr:MULTISPECIES: DUF4352 domain-containing protein [unclassified Microbacterium]EXJ53240.1 hypothetical protein AS96_00410 [Microbacterium sp. MRS-1]ODT23772.1 MAG: DUF4352 domain-containing protein [Microbacterium sp. SCN 69-37]
MSESGSENSSGDDADRADDATARARRNRVLIGGAVAVVVAAIAIVIGVMAARTGASDAASPTPAATSGAATSPGASPTASVPAPSGSGTPASTDAPAPGRETLPPVSLDDTAEVPAGPGVRVTSIEAVEGEAVVPGEIAGPALRVTVEVDNTTADAIDLRTATVTLSYGDPLQPGNPISKPAGAAFPDSVEPGQTASGTFVFEVPKDQRDRVQIAVDLSIDDPIVAFEGSVG